MDSNGVVRQEMSYDTWGRLRNPASQVLYNTDEQPDLLLRRGYTGHEHLPWFGLINMNARLYDPVLGRFLSPDPYVQAADFTQNYNRYSYALNNPLRYTDPDGEWIQIIIGAVVGGIVNVATNWKNIDGFWQGLTSFAVGAGAGAAVAATGGIAGVSGWAVVGVGAGTGAITAGTNSIIAQTGHNFSGGVNWGMVGKSALVGGLAGAAGSGAGLGAMNASWLTGVNSPILNSLAVSPLASAAGHVVGYTANGMLFEGRSFGDAFMSSFTDGFWQSVALGTSLGVATTTATSMANKVNPITGKSFAKNQVRVDTQNGVSAKDMGVDGTLERIQSGERYPHKNDGSIFKNKEGYLPEKAPGYYKEYVHPIPGVDGPGAHRIVIGAGGEVYYSPDHYKTFITIY